MDHHHGRSFDFYTNIQLVILLARTTIFGCKTALDILILFSFCFCNASPNVNCRPTLCSKLTVGLSQAFFGSKVVKFKDTMTPPKLKINGRLYSVTCPVILGLAYLNLSVMISVIILLLSYSIYTTFDLDYCTPYSDCFRCTDDYYDTFVRFNCSLRDNTKFDFENSYYVCFNLLFEPIKMISLLGGFLYIFPPLLFQIFDFIYLRIFFNRFFWRRLTIGQIRICTVPVVVMQSLVSIAYNGLMSSLGAINIPSESVVVMEKYQIEKWTLLVMAFFCYPQGLFTNYDDDITADYQQLQAPQNGINRQQQAQQNGINRQQQAQQNGINRQQQAQRNGANRQRQMQQNRNRSNRQHMPGQQLNNLDLQLPIQQRDSNLPLIRNNVRSGYGSQQNI